MTIDQIKTGFRQVQAHLAIAVAFFIVGATTGYFESPTKTVTKTETKTQTTVATKTDSTDTNVQKQNNAEQKKNDKLYVRVETIAPDGTRTIKTQILDKGTITIDNTASNTNVASADTQSQTSTTSDTTTTKTTEKDKTSTLIYGLAGIQANNLLSGPSYGAGIQKRVLGPIWFGAYGESNTSMGVTVGIGF